MEGAGRCEEAPGVLRQHVGGHLRESKEIYCLLKFEAFKYLWDIKRQCFI